MERAKTAWGGLGSEFLAKMREWTNRLLDAPLWRSCDAFNPIELELTV
jgi:hypothetical protein